MKDIKDSTEAIFNKYKWLNDPIRKMLYSEQNKIFRHLHVTLAISEKHCRVCGSKPAERCEGLGFGDVHISRLRAVPIEDVEKAWKENYPGRKWMI